jgi:hypothetical protein
MEDMRIRQIGLISNKFAPMEEPGKFHLGDYLADSDKKSLLLNISA